VYEAALALADAPDEEALREALSSIIIVIGLAAQVMRNRRFSAASGPFQRRMAQCRQDLADALASAERQT
jgi:hypothetical protein